MVGCATGRVQSEAPMDTFDDIIPEYQSSIIKRYQWWTLLLNQDQRYLGRAVLWLKREGEMQRLSDLTLSEFREMRTALREYDRAIRQEWCADHMNDAWLGNFFHEHGGHGHMHLIPRYKNERIFAGVTFIDGRWGKNYTPYEPYKPEEGVFLTIRDELRKRIRGSVR